MSFPFDRTDRDQREGRPHAIPLQSLDADGTVRFVDDAFTALTGYDGETLRGGHFDEILTDESATAFEGVLEELREGETVITELTVRGSDGTEIPVSLHAQPETDPDGTVTRIHSRIVPEATREAGIDSVLQQNVLLRTLFDGLPVGILAETADRRVQAVNDELLAMFDGLSDREHVVGSDCIELAASASEAFVDPEGFLEGIESLVEARESVFGERLELAGGRLFERHYFPIELRDGPGHLWVYEDVTDKEQRRSELETYERLFEVAPVGVFRTTTDGRVLTVNRKLAEIFGYEDVDALLADYDDLEQDLYVDPGRRETFLERLQEGQVVEDFEYRAITGDGERRWLSMNARLLEETDEGARVITGFTWDVTDRKQHERQLTILDRVLRHNLRNAVTVIQGQAELLATGDADSREAAAAKISERAGALLRQAEKERAIADLVRGTVSRREHDLAELAEDARSVVLEDFPEATVEISSAGVTTISVCDGFEKAIRELLDNAIRHTEVENPTVTVEVRTEPDAVAISVADTGPGIPKMERDLLSGTASETPLYHGVGVGLVLVRELVHYSGGDISFEENDPHGSVVTVRVPRTE